VRATYVTVESGMVDEEEDEDDAIAVGGADEGELVIGGRVFVVEVDDEDDGEGEGGGCSEVAGGVFCEVGGGVEVVGGVLVGGGDDGGGMEEEMEGGGGNDEDGCGLVASAEDESGASWDGADTRDACKMSQPPPPSYHAMSNSHASSRQEYSSRRTISQMKMEVLYFIISKFLHQATSFHLLE